jgi:hypothetical protein
MPAQSPYQRPFRIFAGAAVIVLLVILCIALWTPEGLSDETRKILAWIAGAIVVAAVPVGTLLGFKQGLWKLKEGYRVEVSDGKIIQRRPEAPPVEIPINQIVSLQLRPGRWLVVRGGEPEKQMAVPLEIVGFESLKREISANRTVSKLSPWLFLPSASFVLACLLLLDSQNRTVAMGAGVVALLIQGVSIYSLRQLRRSKQKARFLLLVYILSFVVLGWIVYRRATLHL